MTSITMSLMTILVLAHRSPLLSHQALHRSNLMTNFHLMMTSITICLMTIMVRAHCSPLLFPRPLHRSNLMTMLYSMMTIPSQHLDKRTTCDLSLNTRRVPPRAFPFLDPALHLSQVQRCCHW